LFAAIELGWHELQQSADVCRLVRQTQFRLCGLLDSGLWPPDSFAEGDGIGEEGMTDTHRKVAGRIYALVGTAETDDNMDLVFHVATRARVGEKGRAALETVADDVNHQRPLPSLRDGMRIPGRPLSHDDIDAVGDAINLRSNGTLLFCEDVHFRSEH